jgi:hypothetical protein
MAEPLITIRPDASWEELEEVLRTAPQQYARAEKRAMRGLKRWITRRVMQVISKALKVSQKTVKSAVKPRVTLRGDNAVQVYISLRPIAVHKLGNVRWTPYLGIGSRPRSRPKAPGKGRGARVGREVYPGSWSWGSLAKRGARAGRLVFERGPGGRPRVVTKEIDAPITAGIDAIMPEINDRVRFEMRRALDAERYLATRRRAAA